MCICAYSDCDPIVERQPLWGDYWLKAYLTREMERLDCRVGKDGTQVLLHLFGSPLESLPKGTYNILWLHSHPDWITPEVLSLYQKIYCISKPFVSKLELAGFNCEWLMIPTDARPVTSAKTYDVVFVGNARRDGTRRAIEELIGSPYNVKVWGAGWDGRLPDAWLGGNYFANYNLPELYSQSKIVINDHHPDMRREGFINPRILDVLASGSLAVSDHALDIEDIFEDTVPTFNSAEELLHLVEKYVNDDGARQALVQRGQKKALQFSYASAATKILKDLSLLQNV